MKGRPLRCCYVCGDSIRTDNKDGVCQRTQKCRNERLRLFYRAHPELRKKYGNNYIRNHGNKHITYQRKYQKEYNKKPEVKKKRNQYAIKWRKEHQSHIASYNQQHYWANREKRLQAKAEWLLKNREKIQQQRLALGHQPRSKHIRENHHCYKGGKHCYCEICHIPVGWRSPYRLKARRVALCKKHNQLWRLFNENGERIYETLQQARAGIPHGNKAR